MNKNLCTRDGCPNKGRYARTCGHLEDQKKESEENLSEYLKARKAFLLTHPTCQFGTCQKKATEVHHKRGRGKKYLCDPKTFLAVCGGHHKFIETHPHFAREKGYTLSRLSKSEKPTNLS
jgi:hypothetical protein